MPKGKSNNPKVHYTKIDQALAKPIEGPKEEPEHKLSAAEFLQETSGQELLRVLSKLTTPPVGFGAFVEQSRGLILEPWQWHMANRLERMMQEKGQRVLIHKPPRHGGSTIVSESWPTYLLGRDPMHTFREITHNQEHSEEFSETVQSILRSEEYREIFPATEIPRQTNLTEWSTTKREVQRHRAKSEPSYRAMGIAGAGSGVGGLTFLVDDPYANPKDAHSSTINAEIRRWHNKGLLPRLTPETNLVIMYHRFHPDDYGGWLEQNSASTGNGTKWEILRYAALADNEEPRDPLGRKIDEPLSPRFPWEYLDNMRSSDPEGFYSLYQGLPQDPEGNAVKREWFPFQQDYDSHDDVYGEIEAFDPKRIQYTAIYFDIAASARGDETVGTFGAAMPDNTWTWLWQKTGRWNPGERDDEIVLLCVLINNHMKARGHVVPAFLEEGIGLGRESVERIVKKIRAAGVPAETIRSVGSKWERANDRQDSFRSVAQAGRIRLYCGDYLSPIGLTNAKAECWEPYLREVTQLQVKKVGGRTELAGKDNKWDSGTGLHNALLRKLKRPTITSAQRAMIGRRFGR